MAQSGVLRVPRVQLNNGLVNTMKRTTSPPAAGAAYHQFHPRRVGYSGGELNRNLAPRAWNDRAVEAQLGDLAHETSCFLFGGGSVEVGVAEVLIEGAVA